MSLKNIQYNAVMREYDTIQLENQRIHTERIQQIRRLVPEYTRLNDQQVALSADYARSLIKGTPASQTDYKKNLDALESQKKEALTTAGFPEDYLDPIYRCQDCHDTGFINGAKCHCFKQAIVDLIYAQSNVRAVLEDENFNTFNLRYYSYQKDKRLGISPAENIKNVLESCKGFIKNFDTEYANLLFYGETGVGKTFLSNCIAKELLDTAHTVIYLTAFQLIDILETHTFGSNDDDHGDDHMFSYILDCDLLIIDDLGTEMANSFTTSQLFSCINERHLRKKSTVISTNLSLEDLQETYSERTFSRIISNYNILLILGEDIRIQKAIN